MSKFLIIRFSSLGDIAQAAPVAAALRKSHPKSSVHWVTRSDFAEFVRLNPHVDKVWSFDKKRGWRGLFQLFQELSRENFTHVYDAHNNLRSNLLVFLWRICFLGAQISQRPKNRWKRILLFRFRRNVFPQPFVGALSFLEPLKKWGISQQLSPPPHLVAKPSKEYPFSQASFVVFAPSAAWATKRWPVEHWKRLVHLLPSQNLVLIGGPADTFCEEIRQEAPHRIWNMAGKTSFLESCEIVSQALMVISADTGFLHIADQMGVKNIGLIGPTAFGYTSQPQSKILEIDLYCKPCSKDGRTPCTNPVYQKCMKDISPERVAGSAQEMS